MDAPIPNNFIPTYQAFKAVQSASIQQLSILDKNELRAILPCISRAALCSTLDLSDKFRLVMKEIQKLMAGIEAVTSIVSLLSVDFAVVREDAIKEQQLRRKLGGNPLTGSFLADSIENGSLLAEFERSEPARRIRLVLSEILRLCSLASESQSGMLDTSELFECAVYLQEVSDIICICFAELPDLLPLKEISEALLRVRHGPWLLCRLVGNAPDCFEQACVSILSNSPSSDENNTSTQIRTKALKLLCTMNPTYTKSLRSEAMSKCKLPGLAIELSISNGMEGNESDLIQFLSGILLTSDMKVREWLAEYIRNAQKDAPHSSIHALRTQLIKDAMSIVANLSKFNEVQSDAMDTDSQDYNCDMAKGIALIRLFCALKGMVGYKISNEESYAFLKLITCHPPVTTGGVVFIVTGLSALLACTFIINNPEREDQASKWIEWLCAHQADFLQNASGVSSSFGEMLLLIAIHFHSNNLEAIVDLVTTTLNMKLKLGSLTKMKILFTQQLFPEKVAAEHVLTVPVTKNLNSKLTGFLPVHCVHQLLKSRVFSKHRVDVKDWIYSQICTSGALLHPLMVPLIEAFVDSIIQPIQVGKTGKHHKAVNLDRFSEDNVLRVFGKGSSAVSLTCETTSQLLMLFYALLYQNCLLANMANLISNPKRPTEYSADVYNQMPIKKLLLVSRENQSLYEDIYPPLLRLVIKNYPHLCLVEDYMFEEEIKKESASSIVAARSSGSLHKDKICTPDELHSGLKNAAKEWPKALLLLTKLSVLEPKDLVPYSDALVRSLKSLLDHSVPRKIQTLCCSLWYKLNTLMPRRIWLDTVNVLCCSQANPARNEPFTYEEIVKDPLVVVRCDRRLFRCAPLFDIILRILSAYMDASRAFLSHHIQSHPVPVSKRTMGSNGPSADVEREELKGALVAAQESAIIQILLEICLPTEEERKQSDNSAVMYTVREIQCRVCSFLHQVFISDPNMVKLVHFQGYDAELLAVTVAGVPSMHIAFDFIPELLNMPQLEKQLFAIQLLSYLSMQYPLPKSLSIAKHALNRLMSLAVALPVKKRTQFFLPIMPCLARICTTFPPLREETSELLVTIGKLTHTQLNKDSSLSLRTGRISSSLSSSSLDESDDKGFQDEEMDCTSEADVKSFNTTNSIDSLDLKSEERLSLEIEKTFKEITGDTMRRPVRIEVQQLN